MGQKLKKNAHYIFYLHIFISWKKKGGGSALNIFSIFYTHHRIPKVIYVIKTVMKYHLKKIDTSFHQPLPNMVQRLFADVINDAIWFMNIHEQNHPWFLAMLFIRYGCVPFVVVKHRLSSFLVHHQFFLFKLTNMAGTTNEGRITYHPGALKFTLFCSKAHVAQSLVCYGSLIESPCLSSFVVKLMLLNL